MEITKEEEIEKIKLKKDNDSKHDIKEVNANKIESKSDNNEIKNIINEIDDIESQKIKKEKEKNLEDIIIPKENKYQNPAEHKYNLSIAPMLEITTKHFMHFMRLLTKETLLYSEMINIGQIINKEDCIDFSPDLEPLCIQFGGSNPEKCHLAAEIVKLKGFKEININCGCPSKKVSAGNFGAILMNAPELVGNCVKVMNKS